MVRVTLRLERLYPVLDPGEAPAGGTVIAETVMECKDDEILGLEAHSFWMRYLLPAWSTIRDAWRKQ